MKTRCDWPADDDRMIAYHDTEWGVPIHDDKKHFEFLVLDAFQAGLSWRTILHRREGFRKAFANFDVKKVAKFTDAQLEKLMGDEHIIRNRLKIYGTRKNALAFIAVQKEFGSFDAYIWQFVANKTSINAWKTIKELPAKTKQSDMMSKDMKKRGFTFVGSTICYAYMQAAGLVHDHVIDCFRYKKLK